MRKVNSEPQGGWEALDGLKLPN